MENKTQESKAVTGITSIKIGGVELPLEQGPPDFRQQFVELKANTVRVKVGRKVGEIVVDPETELGRELECKAGKATDFVLPFRDHVWVGRGIALRHRLYFDSDGRHLYEVYWAPGCEDDQATNPDVIEAKVGPALARWSEVGGRVLDTQLQEGDIMVMNWEKRIILAVVRDGETIARRGEQRGNG